MSPFLSFLAGFLSALVLVRVLIAVSAKHFDSKHRDRMAQIEFFGNLYREKFREMIEALKRGDGATVERLDRECEIYAKRVREA